MISNNTKAILLLKMKSLQDGSVDNLKPNEIRKIIDLLHQNKLYPEDLLLEDNIKVLNLIESKLSISASRISQLISQSIALSLNITKWSKLGIWVISIFDNAYYPLALKMKYRHKCPLILFGSGNKDILQKGGIGIVGSRAINYEEVDYTKLVAKKFANNNVVVITGGAKGADETAMKNALNHGGEVICILPAELNLKDLDSSNRRYIEEKKLVLICTENPEAKWTPGRAMARNKYIYLLSNGVLVVASGLKGGTWSGANECLEKGWTKVFAKPSNNPESGVLKLFESGALNHSELDIEELNLKLNYELLLIDEIAKLEQKSIKATKAMLTKKNIKYLDYQPKSTSRKKLDESKQKNLF